MVQQRNIINRKLNILELDATLGNIREACLRLGASRQRCYDIVQTLEQEGMDDLQGRTPGETLREGLMRYDQHACDVLDGRRRRSTIHPGKPNGQP